MKSKGFWRWCIIICKSVFFSFVHRLYFNKITTFRKLDLLPSSGKRGRTKTLAVGLWSFLFLPEDGRRSSFQNVVILLKYRRWTKPKKHFYRIKPIKLNQNRTKTISLDTFPHRESVLKRDNIFAKYVKKSVHIICWRTVSLSTAHAILLIIIQFN
jgi:hypothetical protein